MIAFIIGAPRSGTTIIGRCLDLHPEIAHFYEPYYIWEYYLKPKDTDIRNPAELNPMAKRFIRRNFRNFARKAGKPVIVDKLPENSYRVLYLNAVFSSAKWVHIVRDGRDVTLSMNKEWKRRAMTVSDKDYKYFFFVLKRMFGLQPYWRFRFLQILYELKSGRKIDPNFYLNKSKWKGQPGWGPRFPGWEKAYENHSLIQFNALQWAETVTAAKRGLTSIAKKNVLEIRYEDFILHPKDILKSIIDFLDQSASEKYLSSIPNIDHNNYSKWKNELSAQEIKEIGPLLSSKLVELGYENDESWYGKI
jgi:hypothetical protein